MLLVQWHPGHKLLSSHSFTSALTHTQTSSAWHIHTSRKCPKSHASSARTRNELFSLQWVILQWNQWRGKWAQRNHKFGWARWTTQDTVPSHERPLGATAKPGSQAMHRKEPCVLMQIPTGHTPGVRHSSMSTGQRKTEKKRLVRGYHVS